MQVHDEHAQVERSGAMPESPFRVKVSAKLIRVMSSGIYSDKHQAIVRELSTNAVDAHIAAGRPDDPILVHLPDAEEPWFAVRDNGTGLSHEAIAGVDGEGGIYTTYFDSDKTHSDDFNGCLGLGSKSPFCYGDNFQVTSRHKGTISTYTAFLDGDGMPKITLQASSPTDEPDGLEVRVAVRSGDFGLFEDAARSVYRYFRVPPAFEDAGFQVVRPIYQLRTATLGLLRDRRYASGYGSTYSRVVMGDVAYPLDAAKSQLPGRALTRSLVEFGVDLYVPIGGVEMTASRESLEYTPRTIRAIADALEAAAPEVIRSYAEKIEKAPTWWEARRLFHEMKKGTAWAGDLPPVMRDGRPVDDRCAFPRPRNPDSVLAPGYVPFRGVTLRTKDRNNRKWLEHPVLDLDSTFDATHVVSGPPPLLLIDDVPRHLKATCRRALEDAGEKYALLFEDGDLTPEMAAAEGLADRVVRLSTVPKPEIVRKPLVKREKHLLRELHFSGYGCSWRNERETDASGGGVYIESVRDKVRWRTPAGTAEAGLREDRVRETLHFLQGLDPSLKVVHGVRSADVKRLRKAGPWVNVFDRILELTTAAIACYARTFELLLADDGDDHNGFRHLSATTFHAGSRFGAYMKLRREAGEAEVHRPKYLAALALAGRFGVAFPPPAADHVAALAAVVKLYPLITEVDIDRENVKAVVDYIRLVDDRQAALDGKPKRSRKKSARPELKLTGT